MLYSYFKQLKALITAVFLSSEVFGCSNGINNFGTLMISKDTISARFYTMLLWSTGLTFPS